MFRGTKVGGVAPCNILRTLLLNLLYHKIRNVKTPKEAAKMGRNRSHPLRKDWEEIKDDIMKKAVLCKFQTHSELKAILLATGNQEIVENAPHDYYWGCGQDGSGQNKLGQILREVRQYLLE